MKIRDIFLFIVYRDILAVVIS